MNRDKVIEPNQYELDKLALDFIKKLIAGIPRVKVLD